MGSLRKNGRCAPSLDEPLADTHYVSVFIIHFLNTPARSYGILRKLYLDLDLSIREIVELTGAAWSKTSITEAIKTHNITKGKSLKLLRLMYGYKVVRGQIHPGQKEQRVIKLIMKLHGEEQSFRQIAKYLNDKKIKSKNGGSWDKSVVSAIVTREQEELK